MDLIEYGVLDDGRRIKIIHNSYSHFPRIEYLQSKCSEDIPSPLNSHATCPRFGGTRCGNLHAHSHMYHGMP
nr:MAG TPA: hypothetical protein [Caudoviricetes sp.]